LRAATYQLTAAHHNPQSGYETFSSSLLVCLVAALIIMRENDADYLFHGITMKHTTTPDDRIRTLLSERNRKMASSAHAYVRGSTKRFYQWLSSEHRDIPEGPPIWICGDCHVGNLGPVSDGEGGLAIQIRDLDQTVIGNPAHDLIRLALSLAMAARSSDLPGVATALMIERMMEGYSRAFDAETGTEAGEGGGDVPISVKLALREASGRSWKHLADERIEGEDPVLPLGSRFWPLTEEEHMAVEEMFADERLQSLVLSLRGREKQERVRVADAAYWKKGCSSLGRLRLAVLLKIGKGKQARHCLIDVKEAVTATAPCASDAQMLEDSAERVVAGARSLSPYLGSRMVAAKLLGKSVFVRELLPQDLKLEIEGLSRHEALSVADFLAYTVGLAHARQIDDADRGRWLAELRRNRTQKLDAPSWLWESVVSLIGTHEAAYLEHCRRYALAEAA
jgi:uncharacterized protein (DUF2252 family)